MCGRFEYNPGEDAPWQIAEPAAGGRPAFRYKKGEVFPTDLALVLKDGGQEMLPESMVWGFPKWKGAGVIFNARAETALEKPLFRKALMKGRVVVPTTGFYEWAVVNPSQKKRAKYRFSEADSPFTWLAGFYRVFDEKACFTTLTTEASGSMAAYHSRMPVVLHENEREDWLWGEDWQRYLKRVPFELEAQWVVG